MPETIEQQLVPSAIVEFHAAKESGKEDNAAWQAAVERVRYDVLRIAALLCEQQGAQYDAGTAGAEACHACFTAIEARYRNSTTI